jgi:hypothetical protein
MSPPDQTDAGSNQSDLGQTTTKPPGTGPSEPPKSRFQTIQDLDKSRGNNAEGWATDGKVSARTGKPSTTTNPSSKSQVPQTTAAGTQLGPDPFNHDADGINAKDLKPQQTGT